MKKYNFKSDYSEGAHRAILEKLVQTNTVQQPGYGDDEYSQTARELIRKHFDNDISADIYFVSGGTQANSTVIAAALRPFESVLSATTGHINIHEAGAIESTGHKVEIVETLDGKLTSVQLQQALARFDGHHMTRPQMVYISQPTELGTLYSRSELVDLSQFCKEHNLYLYMDGARLGSALVAAESDVSLGDLTQLIDIFYIGGTKNGALFGEAIVIINDNLKKDFLFYLKQRGALLAKGRVLGIQFMELFSNNLYFDLARHANNMAKKLTNAFRNFGYQFLTESTTNQLFPILPNHVIKKLSEHYDFYVWKKLENDCAAIRLVTSWNTPEPMIDEFVANLEKIN